MYLKTGELWTFEIVHNHIWKYRPFLVKTYASTKNDYWNTRIWKCIQIWKNKLGGWCRPKENLAGIEEKTLEEFSKKYPELKPIFAELQLIRKDKAYNYYTWGNVMNMICTHCVKITYKTLDRRKLL